jgi:hypothetical protein
MPTNPTLEAFVRDRLADSDAAILTAWLADMTTIRPIPLKPLKARLRAMVVDGETGESLFQRIEAIVADGTKPIKVRNGLANFLGQAADDQTEIGSDDDDTGTATKTAALLGYLAAAGVMTAAHVAAIYAMGGGRRHDPAVTPGDVAAARAAVVRADAIDALQRAAVAELTAAQVLHQQRGSRLADLRNDDTLSVPATLAELDAGGE